jgi:hypothetical protein
MIGPLKTHIPIKRVKITLVFTNEYIKIFIEIYGTKGLNICI